MMYSRLGLYFISNYFIMNGGSEIITQHPYAVTSYPGLKNLYLELRQQDSNIPSHLTLELKDMICDKVFYRNKPPLPDGTREVALKPRKIEYELRDKDPTLFFDIFERYQSANLNMRVRWWKKYHLVNRSRELNVHVDGYEYPEKVFICVVTKVSSDRETIARRPLKRYYVSNRTYNTNKVTNGEYIVGRFLFSRNEQNRLIVHSLAEESSPLLEKRAKERYLRIRKTYSPTFYAKHDPICKLDYGQRSRLWTSVLLKDQQISAVLITAWNDCEKISIHFQNQSNVYDEWKISCRLIWPRRKLLVSRSYSNNEVFVFHSHLTGALLTAYQKKVSVVVDTPFSFNFDDVED